jgi:hypothetical protein
METRTPRGRDDFWKVREEEEEEEEERLGRKRAVEGEEECGQGAPSSPAIEVLQCVKATRDESSQRRRQARRPKGLRHLTGGHYNAR